MKTMKNYLWLLLAVVVFVSCDDEDDVMNHGLTAVAGANQEVAVGQTVTLTSAASIDMNDTGFNSQWNLVDRPDGSTANINNAGSSVATFAPDVAGDYLIELTISNDLGEDTDGLIITAIESGTEEIGGSHDDLHLRNIVADPNVPDYVVTSNLTVSGRLTIDAGVRIAVMSDNNIRVNSNGVIMVNGTASEPVYIAGSTGLPGFWRGILLYTNSLENTINHLHVSHAGSNNISAGRPRTAIHLESARINLNNSSFTDNDGYGFSVSGTSGRIIMQNNSFENNSQGAGTLTAGQIRDIDTASNFHGGIIYVQSLNLSIDVDHVWGPAQNSEYRFTGNTEFFDNVTIEAGTQLSFENDALLRFRSGTMIKMLGTASQPIHFRGAVEQPGSWRGITIESSNLENTLEYVHFAHAGHSNLLAGYGRAAIGIGNNARVTIKNAHFNDIDGFGVYIRNDGSRVTFENSNFGAGLSLGAVHMYYAQIAGLDSNTDLGGNYIVADGGNLDESEDVTWRALNNGTVLFTSNGEIRGKVTVEPGARFEFESDILMRVRGIIIADGTASNRIVFTRKTGSTSHWRGISIENTANENLMNYTEVSYGGNNNLLAGYGTTNIGLANNARLTLTNSTISNSLGFGLDIRSGGLLTESGNTFSNNVLGNIRMQ